jgi:hypothetical protein
MGIEGECSPFPQSSINRSLLLLSAVPQHLDSQPLAKDKSEKKAKKVTNTANTALDAQTAPVVMDVAASTIRDANVGSSSLKVSHGCQYLLSKVA